MKRSEREFFIEAIRPYLREGELLLEDGTALWYKPVGPMDRVGDRWYLDCPSSFGTTGRRQIGRLEHYSGWAPGTVGWISTSKRYLGKDWEERMLAEFLRLTGLDQRRPAVWTEKTVEVPCPCCGVLRPVTKLSPAALE